MKQYLISTFIISLVLLSACAPVYEEQTAKNPIEIRNDLVSFSTIEEYEQFAQSQRNTMLFARGIVESSVAMADTVKSLDFSETNNQVAGVDEADIMKTDGEYIYTVTGKTLFIVKAGEDAQLINKITFEGYVDGIFINKDKLVIFGNEYNEDVYDAIGFTPGMTYFHIYDMSDKNDLELLKEYSFEGNYFNARMKDDTIYFITRNTPEYRPIRPLPIVYEDGVARELSLDRILWYPGVYDSSQLVTSHLIDLSGEEEIESLSIAVDNPQSLYMSEDNMYIVGSEYIDEFDIQQKIFREIVNSYLVQEDNELIELIKSTDNRVLSAFEKEQKIHAVYEKRAQYLDENQQKAIIEEVDGVLAEELKTIEYFSYTTLLKINDDLEYVASGKVPGRIVNQFSLDEFQNHLRVATTVDARWSTFGEQTESYTNVFVVDEKINLVGELTGLAPTERIYSTRFIEDKLYMVTFRQVDPFFVIDLSDPNAPTDLGELKIPGFSRYLHPYDENHIIGIGQDATELGRITGLKISLFNVEDVTNPKEVAQFVTDERYAGSSALYEHKAFLFSKKKNLLVIPAYSWGHDGGDKYNGAFVFYIDENRIQLRGLIDHSSGESYFSQVERSLYINDLLYTKSPNLLRVHAIEDLEAQQDVELKEKIGIPIF